VYQKRIIDTGMFNDWDIWCAARTSGGVDICVWSVFCSESMESSVEVCSKAKKYICTMEDILARVLISDRITTPK